MIELDCPLCAAAVAIAPDAPALWCADCAITVEIDPLTVSLALAA